MTSPKPQPQPTDWCGRCHHNRSLHIPVCCDAMLGFGKYCDCPEFIEEEHDGASTDEPEEAEDAPTDPAAKSAGSVPRPSVRPPAS